MRRAFRLVAIAATLMMASLAARAASLSSRLPQDAWLIAEIDVAALREGGWVVTNFPSADPFLVALREGGFVPSRDVSRLALGVLPGASSQDDAQALVLAQGRFERKAVEAALVRAGGEMTDVGSTKAVKMPIRELRFADSSAKLSLDEPLLVSFLGDAIAVGTRRATKAVHEAKAPPGLLLSKARKDVSPSAAHWLVADMTRKSHASSEPPTTATRDLRTLAAWGSGSDVIDLRAVALAADAATAKQAAVFAPVALGLVTSSQADVSLEDVKVEAEAEKLTAHARLVRVRATAAPKPASGS